MTPPKKKNTAPSTETINSDDLVSQIAVTLIPGIGSVSGKKLVAYCGSAQAVFKESRKALQQIKGMNASTIDAIFSKEIQQESEAEALYIQDHGVKPLFFTDIDYPQRLLQCDDSPVMLYYKGTADLNASRVVAIVGTRNITDYGMANCEQLVKDLTDDGVLIVSGLAYGVDTLAHRCCVRYGIPTVGVMGNGMNLIYPSENKGLVGDMLKNGGLLTEFTSDTKPDRENFPRRNRIIAGMADAVVVIESAMKGGSLITANIANSYNRDVFAFPGRVMDIYSQGCNHLIRVNRANMIESVANLRYVMRWDSPAKKETQTVMFRDFTEEEQLVMDCFKDADLVNLDDIIVKTGLQTTKIASLLLALEFDGIVLSLPGKRFQRC